MTASVALLSTIVSVALVVTAIAPLLLFVLWLLDLKKGQLW
jgi:hypothetical protein